MKYRLILVLGLVLAGLFLDLGSAQSAHAATAVQLTATQQSNLQAVLNVTKVTLDAIQVQVDHNAVKDPAAMIVTLNGIKGYLLTIRGLLGGSPVATAPATPSDSQTVAVNPVQRAADSQPTVQGQGQQTASVNSAATSRWAFWVILIVTVMLAIVLAMPRRNSVPMAEGSEAGSQPSISQPSLPVPEEPQTIQSA